MSRYSEQHIKKLIDTLSWWIENDDDPYRGDNCRRYIVTSDVLPNARWNHRVKTEIIWILENGKPHKHVVKFDAFMRALKEDENTIVLRDDLCRQYDMYRKLLHEASLEDMPLYVNVCPTLANWRLSIGT